MKTRVLGVGIGVVVAAAVVFLLGQLGFPMPFVAAWMIVILAIVLAGRQVFFDESASWPPEKPRRDSRGSDVSRLAWAINARTGVVGHVVVRRVQSVLRRRLAHRGLDLDDPHDHARIDAVLGEGVRDAFHRREVQRADVERVLDAIERIPNDTKETA